MGCNLLNKLNSVVTATHWVQFFNLRSQSYSDLDSIRMAIGLRCVCDLAMIDVFVVGVVFLDGGDAFIDLVHVCFDLVSCQLD